jgi:hypothetical protein
VDRTFGVDSIRLFLGQPLVQGLPLGLLRSGGAEQLRPSVTIPGVTRVVTVTVEQCVLGAVTFEDLAGVVASGHSPPRNWPHRRGRASGQRRL